MLLLFGQRLLSNLNFEANYNLRYLWCFLVLIFNTSRFVYSANQSTVSPCLCNSTTSESSHVNSSNATCNCVQNDTNCQAGYHLSNGTCVDCFCNSTIKPPNCDCSYVPKSIVCLPGQYLSNSSQTCKVCNCNVHASFNNTCNNKTGQCFCRQNVTGPNCTICIVNYLPVYHSSSGELLTCVKECPKGFTKTMKNECIRTNSKKLQSSLVLSRTNGIVMSKDNIPTTTLSVMLASLSPEVPYSPETLSALVKSSSSSLTSSVTMTKSASKAPTFQTATTIILSASQTLNVQPALSSKPPQPPLPFSLSPSSSLPSSTPSKLQSPSSSQQPSPPLSSTTGHPTTKLPPPTTPNHQLTTGDKSSPKPETDKPTSEKPTTRVHHTKMPSDERSSDVVVIVVTCLGVVIILGIAVAVGCYCLRTKRKPSTPFWTVELSNTRNNEELDFALLDPVTDEPQKKANESNEADASVTEHSRYYAYI